MNDRGRRLDAAYVPCSRCGQPHHGVRTIIAGEVVCSACTYLAEYGGPRPHLDESAYADLDDARAARQLQFDQEPS